MPCRWTSEAVSLDNFGGMRGVARCAARELARVGKLNGPVKAGARLGADGKSFGLYLLLNGKSWQLPGDSTKMVKVGELP